MTEWDVIVVGLGVVGLSAAGAAAARGARVLGLDRGPVPSPEASSAADTRVFRQAYFEHPDYVPLLREAHDAWRDLEREAGGGALLDLVGGLYVGRPGTPFVEGSRSAAEAHGLPYEMMDAGGIRRRFPLAVPEDFVGMLEAGAGVLHGHRAMPALLGRALERGAELHGHERVTAWSAGAAGVEVATTSGRHRGARMIVTAGAWAPSLLRDAGLPVALQPTLQTLIWCWPRRPEAFVPARMPIWGVDQDGTGHFHYGFPLGGQRPGVKFSQHGPGRPVVPDEVDRTPAPDEVQDLLAALRTVAPDASGPLLAASTCLYTLTPDGNFVIDRLPATDDRVVVGVGMSGHGFKLAPVLGAALADLALDGGSSRPIEFLRWTRARAEVLS